MIYNHFIAKSKQYNCYTSGTTRLHCMAYIIHDKVIWQYLQCCCIPTLLGVGSSAACVLHCVGMSHLGNKKLQERNLQLVMSNINSCHAT